MVFLLDEICTCHRPPRYAVGAQHSLACPSASPRFCLYLIRSFPVDFASLHPSGCLQQSFSRWSIVSPSGLPSGSLIHKVPTLFLLRSCLSAVFLGAPQQPRFPSSRPAAWVWFKIHRTTLFHSNLAYESF